MTWNSTLKTKTPLKSKKTLQSKKGLKSKTVLSSKKNSLKQNSTMKSKTNLSSKKGFSNKKSKQAIAHDISTDVKKRVFERDGGACVVCGNKKNVFPNAHYIPRSKGGRGIEENVVTLCSNFTKNQCHHKMDNGRGDEQKNTKENVERYLLKKYPDWKKEDVIYSNK